MGVFVLQHIGLTLRGHIRGKVDFGFDNAQNKRSSDAIAQVEIVPQTQGYPNLSGKPDIADGGIQKHRRHTRKPDG